MARIFPATLTERQPFVTKLLTNAVGRRRLSHAYLLTGRAQSDKWEIARDLACFLNCAHVNSDDFPPSSAQAPKPEGQDACILRFGAGNGGAVDTAKFCQQCRWIWDGKHPQAWLILGPNEGTKSGKISVEKARKLSEELAKESQFVRIVVIENAGQDTFHRPAANALLKTIEDPRVRCVFLMFANSAEEVLPTVVSRCQLLPLYTTESLGLSLKNADLSGYNQDALRLGQDMIEKFMHRRGQDSQSLSRIIDFNKALGELINDEFTGSDAVDLLIGLELKHLGQKTATDPASSGYAKQLLALSEATKEQLLHYVSAKAALETFLVSWWRLTGATVNQAAAH